MDTSKLQLFSLFTGRIESGRDSHVPWRDTIGSGVVAYSTSDIKLRGGSACIKEDNQRCKEWIRGLCVHSRAQSRIRIDASDLRVKIIVPIILITGPGESIIVNCNTAV